MIEVSEGARRRNILLLLPTFADPGGTQKLLRDLGEMLAERHNVFECAFDAHREPRAFENGNPVLTLGVPRANGRVAKFLGYGRKAFRLNRLKKRHAIDITISNLWPADFINALSMGPGERWSYGIVNVEGNAQNAPMLAYRWAVGWLYRRFHMTIAINRDLMHELRDLFQLSPLRVVCIPAFVKLRPVRQPAASASGRTLVWFGRLHWMKNLPPMFEILKGVQSGFPGTQLMVIGEGPQRQELVDAARVSHLRVSETPDPQADVVFLGFVPDPFEYLSRSDVFVLTSRSEGFGLVVVEAMNAGLPLLVSDCPTGGPHFIMEGKGAFAHGRRDPEVTPYGHLMPIPECGNGPSIDAWVRCISALLADADERRRMGTRSLARAKSFSFEHIKPEWFELIDAV